MSKRISILSITVILLLVTTCAFAAGVIQLPQTGQTISYSAGDDGDLKTGIAWPSPRFKPNTDTTITDNLTGLIWASDLNIMPDRDPGWDADNIANDGKVTWQHALDYITKLNAEKYLGHNDWRLPNRKELWSLIDHSKSTPALSEGHPFTNVPDGYYAYWSSTHDAYYAYVEWIVDFSDGYMLTFSDSQNTFYVWPVRSGQAPAPASLPKTGQTAKFSSGDDGDLEKGIAWPNPRFTDNGNGTITDNLTGLIWLKTVNCSGSTSYTMTWAEALSYVKTIAGGQCGLTDGSQAGDWRLPNINELESLVNAGATVPDAWLINQGFINVLDKRYWTSTAVASDVSRAWIVYMWNGSVYHYPTWLNYYVWPVRSGQADESVDYYCDKDNDGYINSSPSGSCTASNCVPKGCQTTAGDDCNDNNKTINPDAKETCDGKDNDCDADTADGIDESWYESTTNCGVGVCSSIGQYTCSAGKKTDTCTPRLPVENTEQSCTDTFDNDCDGKTDSLDSDCYSNKLIVTKSGTGIGTVTSSPKGVNCGSDCTESYLTAKKVTLTAKPDAHSYFAGWSGDYTGSKTSASITVNGEKTCAATFNPKSYELKVSTTGNGKVISIPSGIECGTGSKDCSEKYEYNTKVTLTTSDSIYGTFIKWTGCDKGSDLKAKTCTVTMDKAKTVTALFTSYKLTVTKSGTGAKVGSVTSNPSGIDCGTDCTEGYAPATQVTLTAASNSAATFTGWSVKSCGAALTCTVTMDKAKSVTASYASYELKVVKSGKGAKGGTITSNPPGIDCGTDCKEGYAPGTSVTLTAATDSATAFTGWSEKSCINTTCEVTLDKAKSVTARFSNTSSITGYVKDITGKGMAGITVTAYLDDVKVKASTTDAKGKYILEVPVSVEEVEYMLSVGKAGYGFSPSEQFILVSNINVTTEEDFIGFIYVVKGTVVMDRWNASLEEFELKPVSGATVKLKKVTGENEEGELTYKVIAAVTTGKNGTFSFSKNVTPYDEYEISASYKKLTGSVSIDVTATTDGIIDTGEIMIEDFTEEEF